MLVNAVHAPRFALASILICPRSPLPRNQGCPLGRMVTESSWILRGVFAGVTAAQLVPMRNSSHCMFAGREFAPDAAFCRKLKRSMIKVIPLVLVSVPVMVEMKPLVGAEGAAKVLNGGSIQSETAFGAAVKSY